MAFPILYAEEKEQVHRHSSLDQFKDGFISAWKQGGWAPILFDQLDSIGECSGIKSHPVIVSFGYDLGYIFPEKKCTYVSDRFIYFDKRGVEQRVLPECFGGKGEFFDLYVDKSSFINFDGDDGGSSLGTHNKTTLRIGVDYVKADETLPAID